ncbi:MAG TPA: flavin reductase family protein [Mycobacterium sp.]
MRRAFSRFPSGVVAVCAEVGGRLHGMAVSTFVPVSLDPPFAAFCVQNTSTTWPNLAAAEHLGLSLLGLDQHHAAKALAARNSDRFSGVRVRREPTGAVLVHDAATWIEGTVETEVPAGDHAVVILRIRRLSDAVGGDPLVFHDGGFRQLARRPA